MSEPKRAMDAAMDHWRSRAATFGATLIGLPAEEAESKCEAAGYVYRMIDMDRPSAITADLRYGRVNVWLRGGVVTQVTGG